MKVGVVGLGLIGGSIAKDLKALGHHITGADKSKKHLEMAYDIGLVDDDGDLEEVAKNCDVVFLSVPVDFIEPLAIQLLDLIKWTGVCLLYTSPSPRDS